MIYKATGNLRAVQILLGHGKIENTIRYLGVDIDDALTLAELTEICLGSPSFRSRGCNWAGSRLSAFGPMMWYLALVGCGLAVLAQRKPMLR